MKEKLWKILKELGYADVLHYDKREGDTVAAYLLNYYETHGKLNGAEYVHYKSHNELKNYFDFVPDFNAKPFDWGGLTPISGSGIYVKFDKTSDNGYPRLEYESFKIVGN